MEIHKNSYEVIVITTGDNRDFGYKLANVGSQTMSALILWILETLKPDYLINAGTAGALKDFSEIGDVYIVGSTEYLDRIIPIPEYKDYALYTKKINTSMIRVFTSNSLITRNDEIEEMKKYSEIGIPIKDMEAAAIVQICEWYSKIPIIIKSITDIVDDNNSNSADQFIKNFELAIQNLAYKLNDFIGLLTFSE